MVTLEDGNLGTVIERSEYPERQQKDGPKGQPHPPVGYRCGLRHPGTYEFSGERAL
jgi:hypothetical protein